MSNVEENFSSVEEPPAAQLYDSLRSINIDSKLKSDVCSIIGSKLNRVQFHIMNVEGQRNTSDCGIYAIAYGTHLAQGETPTLCHWRHDEMRNHLKSCLEVGEISLFPARGNRLIRSSRRILKTVIEQIYCYCRMPNDKSKSMVQCSQCCQWYHLACVNLGEQVMCEVKWSCLNCV